MSSLIEPQGPGARAGHAEGDVGPEELAGGHAGGEGFYEGHFTTHFDEPSIDFSDPQTKITQETREELRLIAACYPQARSAVLPMLPLVQSVEGRVTPAGIEACADILGISTADVSGVATFYTMYKRRRTREY